MTKGDLELYKMGGEVVESHLALVDDFIFFTRASYKSFTAIKAILTKFTQSLGLQVNSRKSYIIYSKKVHDFE